MDTVQTPHTSRRAPSRSLKLTLAIGVALLVVGTVVVLNMQRSDGAGAPAAADSNATTQTNTGGNVTVAVAWSGASAGPVFDVKLDTHSVDLDKIDLRALAVLRVDGEDIAAVSWEAPKGGHHREGTLSFPATATDGRPLVTSQTTIELIVRDVAGVAERRFTWTP